MPQLIYTVQPGETLSGIARLYGSTVQAIININNIINPNLIYPGTVILIPVEEEDDPSGPPGSLIYTVQPGDTLYTISLLFGVSVQSILATVARLGYITIMWTVDSLDWKNPGVQQIIDRVVNNIEQGAIVLMHQAAPQTPDALPVIISRLRQQGYSFGTVTQVLDP